jgi:hypothetical protein
VTLSFLDIALPIGLALVFAVFRYGQYRATDPQTALPRAAADGVKGAIGLAVITLGYKYFIH